MICVSIGDPASLAEALKRSPLHNGSADNSSGNNTGERSELAEIRLDLLPLSIPEINELFARPAGCRFIAAYRPGAASDKDRQAALLAAVESGAYAVDIEIEAAADYRETIVTAARRTGCRVIVSFHDEEKTPSLLELLATVNSCFDYGADIAKIACLSRGPADNACLLSLYEAVDLAPSGDCRQQPDGVSQKHPDSGENKAGERQIIVIGMGQWGKITRVAAPLLGAPFTYAAAALGRETAVGQLDNHTLQKIYNWIHPRVMGQM